MSLEPIRQRYAGKASSEWERLHSIPITRIEYLITRHCLERYLPGTGLILDVDSDLKRWPVWKEVLLETCNNSTIIGASNHLLVIARKPGSANEQHSSKPGVKYAA